MPMPVSCPPLRDSEWPETIANMKSGFAGRLNVYRVMARHPALLSAWSGLRNHVVLDNALGKQRSEVAILRTGHRLGSDYEWKHHVSRGRACGMSDERIASIAGEIEGMSDEDAAIARAVDEMFDEKRINAQTLEGLSALVGIEGVFDVIATVGMYSTLGYIVNTFSPPLDDDVEAELSKQPLLATFKRHR
jgi:4-carboxymuconolactone decarboxylase